MSDRAELEASVRRLCEAGTHDEALSVALRRYGRELFGFLAAMTRGPEDAAEIYSTVCEEMWKSLPRFQWRSAFRTWAYTIARRCLIHFRRAPHRAADRNIALSNVDAFSKLQLQVRTETAAYKRTAVKSKFAALRESLPEEDQMLLVLRVDKGMAWMDIAGVLFPDSEDDDEARKKESARLRKRFETLKKHNALIDMWISTGSSRRRNTPAATPRRSRKPPRRNKRG